jgi:predicted GNAT family acetyltransferase
VPLDIHHDPDRRRFVASGPNGEGFLSYSEIAPGVLDFEYVEVPPRFRGQGVAGQIVEAACRYARDAGVRVVPSCPYIAAWFRHHAEWRALLHPMDSP